VLFPKTENLTFVIDNPEKSISDPNGQPWDTLPRIIWLFWDSGHENAPLSNQLAVESIKRRAKESGFEVKLVNNNNVHLYLDNETLARIDYSLKNAKVTVFPQSKSDFIRLALIAAHGGIYLDSSYVAITNFDWIINISRYPS
jgi:mannosyltransferase OCH1-like enzyme